MMMTSKGDSNASRRTSPPRRTEEVTGYDGKHAKVEPAWLQKAAVKLHEGPASPRPGSAGKSPSLTARLRLIKSELGINDALPAHASIARANAMTGLRAEGTLPQQIDRLLGVWNFDSDSPPRSGRGTPCSARVPPSPRTPRTPTPLKTPPPPPSPPAPPPLPPTVVQDHDADDNGRPVAAALARDATRDTSPPRSVSSQTSSCSPTKAGTSQSRPATAPSRCRADATDVSPSKPPKAAMWRPVGNPVSVGRPVGKR